MTPDKPSPTYHSYNNGRKCLNSRYTAPSHGHLHPPLPQSYPCYAPRYTADGCSHKCYYILLSIYIFFKRQIVSVFVEWIIMMPTRYSTSLAEAKTSNQITDFPFHSSVLPISAKYNIKENVLRRYS